MGVGWGKGWIIFLRWLAVWALHNVYNFSFQLKFLEIHLFFSISLLLSISLKHCNFPDNFYFKGNIAAKFFIRNPSLLIKTIWQKNNKLNMGLFNKYFICIMAFFTPFNYLSVFVNFTLTLPLCYLLTFTKKP